MVFVKIVNISRFWQKSKQQSKHLLIISLILKILQIICHHEKDS